MRVSYHPLADAEVVEAAQYYEERSSGLGARFLHEVDVAVERLCADPTLRAADRKGQRKWRVHDFPYNLIYKLRQDEIFVLAVAHGSRRPGYWEGRE